MLISLQEAQQLVVQKARFLGTETVALPQVQGRVIAEFIVADRDYPPFNRAAMDGFAIKSADWDLGCRTFQMVETIFAGSVHTISLQQNDCYKIMTGAAVPPDADTIIRVEDSHLEGINVSFANELKVSKGQNVAAKGQDMHANTLVLPSHTRCTPAVTTLLASLGKYNVLVHQLPKVAIVTTGNEVKEPDSAVNEVQIRNSNKYLLMALLQQWQIAQPTCLHLPDHPELLNQGIESVLQHDIVICCGGVSAGDADFVPQILQTLGVQKLFHKVAIRPGKPIWCGTMPNGGLFFALPGNPFSCMVTFMLFVVPYLRACFGMLPQLPSICLPLANSRTKKTAFDEFFPVSIQGQPAQAHSLPFNGSGDITAAMLANGIAQHPNAVATLSENDIVAVLLT